MYRSLGEDTDFIDDMIQEDEVSSDGGVTNREDYVYGPNSEDPFRETEVLKPSKMFWHALHIDKVQELVPEQIRWFYKEDPKAKWVPFIGYDSLRIECRYRALEYSKIRSDDKDAEDIDMCIHVRGGLYEVDINNNRVHPVYWKGASLPILRGTWFFDGSWQPLEYEYSLQLEHDHLAMFRGKKIPDPSVQAEKQSKLEVKHNIKFEEFHVDWYDISEVYMFSESASSRMFRFVTNKLSIQKSGTGTKLHRGYFEEAKMDDKPSDVTHLVFVVHGIGQKYNQNRIISCCNDLRNNSTRIIQTHFPDLLSSNHRIEFLPVEWRTDLKLDGDIVDSITPEKLKNLRVILNATAMDILYYTSPLYRGEIINGLNAEMNRLYSMFCERHPYFEANGGLVSVCAHSLGSVILYDILTGWDPIELYDQYVCKVIREHSKTSLISNLDSMTSTERSHKLHDFYINSLVHKNESSLSFKVTHLFNLGSPLGVFLTLRGIRPKSNGLMEHLLPKALCKRFYNIYHPSDPVAYRVEPLVLRHYSAIAPLKIHHLQELNKEPYANMKAKALHALTVKATTKKDKMEPASSESLSGSQQSVSSSDSSANKGTPESPPIQPTRRITSMGYRAAAGFGGALKSLFNKVGGHAAAQETRLTSEMDKVSVSEDESVDSIPDSPTFEQTELEYRLDYVLPSSSMSNSYVGAIFSHTSYWSSPEVALFLLTHLIPDYGPMK